MMTSILLNIKKQYGYLKHVSLCNFKGNKYRYFDTHLLLKTQNCISFIPIHSFPILHNVC